MQQLTAAGLTLVRDVPRDNPLHGEALRVGVAAGGERLVARPQEARLVEAALGPGQHDVGWDEAGVAAIVPLELRDDGPEGRVNQPAAGLAAGLDDVRSGLVAVIAVGHAADDGVLVGLLRELGQQLPDLDPGHVRVDRTVERPGVVVARVGLRVEGVGVRRAAPHPDLNDRLRPGRPVRARRRLARRLCDGRNAVRECQPGGSPQHPLQRVAPGHEVLSLVVHDAHSLAHWPLQCRYRNSMLLMSAQARSVAASFELNPEVCQ